MSNGSTFTTWLPHGLQPGNVVRVEGGRLVVVVEATPTTFVAIPLPWWKRLRYWFNFRCFWSRVWDR